MKNDLEEIRGILLETKKNPLVLNNYEYIIYDLKKRVIAGLELSNTYAIDTKYANKVYELLLFNGFDAEIKGEFKSGNQQKTLIKVEVENIKKMK